VVPVEDGVSDGWSMVQTSMRPVPVALVKQSKREHRPIRGAGLDEALRVAVGARRGQCGDKSRVLDRTWE
jgi:hypothetical protein